MKEVNVSYEFAYKKGKHIPVYVAWMKTVHFVSEDSYSVVWYLWQEGKVDLIIPRKNYNQIFGRD